MPNTSIICGSLLVIIGLVGYGYGLMNGNASLTALIPAAFGFVLEICGFVAKSKEPLRKHLMHVAVVVALLGFIMTAGRLLMKIWCVPTDNGYTPMSSERSIAPPINRFMIFSVPVSRVA